MLLTINANNTNVKFAVCRDGRMIADWRLKTDAQRTADQYIVWLNQLMQMSGMALSDFDGCISPEESIPWDLERFWEFARLSRDAAEGRGALAPITLCNALLHRLAHQIVHCIGCDAARRSWKDRVGSVGSTLPPLVSRGKPNRFFPDDSAPPDQPDQRLAPVAIGGSPGGIRRPTGCH